jgi:cation transport ATPase
LLKSGRRRIWGTGRAAGITFGTSFLMTPAVGAGLMSASTLIVAINAQLLRNAIWKAQ